MPPWYQHVGDAPAFPIILLVFTALFVDSLIHRPPPNLGMPVSPLDIQENEWRSFFLVCSILTCLGWFFWISTPWFFAIPLGIIVPAVSIIGANSVFNPRL